MSRNYDLRRRENRENVVLYAMSGVGIINDRKFSTTSERKYLFRNIFRFVLRFESEKYQMKVLTSSNETAQCLLLLVSSKFPLVV